MKFFKFILLMIVSIMSTLQVQAQNFQISALVGKTWVANSGYDGSENIDWSVVFSAKSSEHKFIGKTTNKSSVFTYNTYLCSSKPERYDASLLGSTSGKYIVFERKYSYKGKVYEDFFCSEILSLTSNQLRIRVNNSTILFIAK